MTVFPEDLDLRGRRVRLRGPVDWFDTDSPVITIPLDAVRWRLCGCIKYWFCLRSQRLFAFQKFSANAEEEGMGEDIEDVLPAQNDEEGS